MNRPISSYKAIFFDAGDTLVTIPATHEMMSAYLEGQRFYPERDTVKRLLDQAITRFYYNKTDYADAACTPESDRVFWIGIYRYLLDRLGAHSVWTEEQLHRICHELYDLFVSPEYYALFDDVAEVLERLAQRGFRLGLVSNFAPTLRDILTARGIAHYFDPLVVSTEAGLEKPNPAIFKLALELAGLAPHEVLYIGDHETNDIWAPRQAGIDARRIYRYGEPPPGAMRTLRELLADGDGPQAGGGASARANTISASEEG